MKINIIIIQYYKQDGTKLSEMQLNAMFNILTIEYHNAIGGFKLRQNNHKIHRMITHLH